MKAIRFSAPGGPDVLRYEDVELPPPPPGCVRVRHRAIGVNFIDTYHRSGLYKLPMPSGLGLEAAGIIEAMGDGVTHLTLGERVGYCTGPLGAYAEAHNVPADNLVKLPAALDDRTAAASMMKGFTAWYLLRRTSCVAAGQTVLFHAAAGGVGLIAGQWAKHLGVRILGTVGSDEKKTLALANGYDAVFNLRHEDWVKGVREATNGAGVPVVYDSVGKDTFEGSLDCLSPRGLLVSFGNASGPVPPFDPGILNAKGSLFFTRPTLFHYTNTAETLKEAADDFFGEVLSGAIKVTIGQTFALKDARAAHEALHARKTLGSTILVP